MLQKQNLWPHEIWALEALNASSYQVRIIPKSNRTHEKSADFLINGLSWELKSPKGNLGSIHRNLHRARQQSPNIIISSQRMKIPDRAILRELISQSKEVKNVNRILFIDKKRKIIDIK